MTDFATADTPLGLGFAGGERREVVMEDELLVFLDEDLVHLLHVHLCSEGYGSKGLCLAAGEYRGTVCARQAVHFAPDRTDLGGLATVDAQSFVEYEVPQSLSLLVTEVTVDHHLLGLEVFLGESEGLDAFFLDRLESGFPLMLWLRRLGESVALCICRFVDLVLDIFVFLVVRIFSLDILAQFLVEFLLDTAMLLDLFVSELDGLEHHIFRNFLHFALYHHDVLLGSTDHQFEVGRFGLGERRIDLELSVDPGDAYLGDRTEERKVAARESCRCSKSCESIRLDVLFGRDEPDVDEYCKVEIIREQRPEGPVDETCDKYFVIGGLALPLHETARKTSCGIKLFLVIHLEWKEVCVFCRFFCACNSGKEHRASHLYHCRTVCLLGNLTGFDFDYPTVG